MLQKLIWDACADRVHPCIKFCRSKKDCLICGELNESNAPTVKNTWNSKWSSWAVPYLDKAFELGLITEQDTKFKLVGIPCTRGEMAKVITRAVEYLKEEPVADTSTYIAKLNDYDRMKEEYKPYVLQALSLIHI